MASDVIALASFYLTIVGLLISLFFISLTQWLNSALALASKWKVFAASRDRLENAQYYDRRLDFFGEAAHASSWVTAASWVILTAFMGYVMWLMRGLGLTLDASSQAFLYEYVKRPCYSFFGLYVFISFGMLWMGYRNARCVLASVRKTV